MSDHQHLHDAFAEYERRADAVGAARASAPSTRPAREPRGPLLLIAASVVLVLAIAGGVVWLAGGIGSGGSKQPAGDGPNAPMSTSARTSASAAVSSSVAASTAPPQVILPPAPVVRSGVPTTVAVPPPSTPPGKATSTPAAPVGSSSVPANARQMERAFRRALGDTATFTVTETHGNYIIGVLTDSATGEQGGFDIQALGGSPGDEALCEDADTSHCTMERTANGGSLATGHESTEGDGILYLVDYVHPDGASFLMHLSNLADPKGAGKSFGSRPPLTEEQMTAILQSDAWNRS